MPIASAALILWIPISIGIFSSVRPARALTYIVLGGWLLLPAARLRIEGFPDFDKLMAINLGAFLGAVMFRASSLGQLRWTMADGWLLVYCGAQFIASLMNGLGVYDGVSASTHTFFMFGMPYALARCFLRTREDIYDATRIIVIGAACCAVLAVWEWRMSPRLHINCYGFFQHGWRQVGRWGFWRPILFFPHPLALGQFFVWVSLVGIALVKAKRLGPVLGLPPWAIPALPIVGLVVSMSLGPWSLFALGLALFYAIGKFRRLQWMIALPVIAATFWMGVRYMGLSDGRWLVAAAADVSEERADSLLYRIDAETRLVERAKQHPVFGWGGWGRNRIRDEFGRDLVYTDGLWVLILGTSGLLGMLGFYLWWWWPVLLDAYQPSACRGDPVLSAYLLAIGLQSISFLFNGFISPVFVMMFGAVVGVMHQLARERRFQHAQARFVRFA